MVRTRKRKSKPYVRYSTVNKAKNKCNKMSGNGSSDICIVGQHKLLVTRGKNGYDKNGKPVNSATLIRTDGTLGATYRDTTSIAKTLIGALRKNGISVK